ncbi:hypothetical protein JCM31826_06400 [Thermaurantimonas aggregans]|uniref:Uncharacterized protein n=1 Tax=Thermaurantimonas aggregans TaxID=2173829 RepID=A0A401XJJ1_9FLAO|nr:hypothetical protein JCM31826_06400 [Thermaurantimonas aggregans]
MNIVKTFFNALEIALFELSMINKIIDRVDYRNKASHKFFPYNSRIENRILAFWNTTCTGN